MSTKCIQLLLLKIYIYLFNLFFLIYLFILNILSLILCRIIISFINIASSLNLIELVSNSVVIIAKLK